MCTYVCVYACVVRGGTRITGANGPAGVAQAVIGLGTQGHAAGEASRADVRWRSLMLHVISEINLEGGREGGGGGQDEDKSLITDIKRHARLDSCVAHAAGAGAWFEVGMF